MEESFTEERTFISRPSETKWDDSWERLYGPGIQFGTLIEEGKNPFLKSIEENRSDSSNIFAVAFFGFIIYSIQSVLALVVAFTGNNAFHTIYSICVHISIWIQVFASIFLSNSIYHMIFIVVVQVLCAILVAISSKHTKNKDKILKSPIHLVTAILHSFAAAAAVWSHSRE